MIDPIPGVSLIIPAAGTGSRFGGPVPKQFALLAGSSVLRRSLLAFSECVDEAFVACDLAHADVVQRAISALPFPVQLVAGGRERQDSVAAALAQCRGARVLVHDAVRPLVPVACIRACLAALETCDAAVVAVPCAATVKRAGRDGLVAATVPRRDLHLAQTPQGFRRSIGVAAFARAAAEGWVCTDDAEVLERAGARVALVPGDARNLKITTPDDLAVATALLATDPTRDASPA